MGEAIITGAKEGWTVAIPAGGILTTGRAGAGVVLRFQVFLTAWVTTICMIYVQSGCCIWTSVIIVEILDGLDKPGWVGREAGGGPSSAPLWPGGWQTDHLEEPCSQQGRSALYLVLPGRAGGTEDGALYKPVAP